MIQKVPFSDHGIDFYTHVHLKIGNLTRSCHGFGLRKTYIEVVELEPVVCYRRIQTQQRSNVAKT
jgi:hypothetical protein